MKRLYPSIFAATIICTTFAHAGPMTVKYKTTRAGQRAIKRFENKEWKIKEFKSEKKATPAVEAKIKFGSFGHLNAESASAVLFEQGFKLRSERLTQDELVDFLRSSGSDLFTNDVAFVIEIKRDMSSKVADHVAGARSMVQELIDKETGTMDENSGPEMFADVGELPGESAAKDLRRQFDSLDRLLKTDGKGLPYYVNAGENTLYEKLPGEEFYTFQRQKGNTTGRISNLVDIVNSLSNEGLTGATLHFFVKE